MSKPANKKAIGAFVVVGLALAVAAVVVLGSGKFFERRDRFVAYFQGSVKGLRVGAPVVFRGVTVGEVVDMMILTDRKERTFEIPVFMEIDDGSFRAAGQRVREPKKYFQLLVQDGLRAQLQLQSLVTGQLMVNIDFFPGTPVRLVGSETADVAKGEFEIPTIQTSLQKLEQTLEDVPIGEIANSINRSLNAIEQIVTSDKFSESLDHLGEAAEEIRNISRRVDEKIDPLSADVQQVLKDAQGLLQELSEQVKPLASSLRQTSDEAGATFQDARRLIGNVDSQVEPLAGRLGKSLEAAYATLREAERSLGIVSGMMEEGAPLRVQLETTFGKLGQAANSIQALADYLQRNPDALIRGKSASGGF